MVKMKQLKEYILEKLHVSKFKKEEDLFVTDYENFKPSKQYPEPQITEDQIRDIEEYCKDLKPHPNKITNNKNGGIRIIWDKKYQFFSEINNYRIDIIKPERYEGCFKIVWYNGSSRPYEIPQGNNGGHLNKDGSLKFPDIDSVFEFINKNWDKKWPDDFLNYKK